MKPFVVVRDDRCGACVHYCAQNETQGECRISPPVSFLVPVASIQGQGMGFSSQWPAVHGINGWCSEFDSGAAEIAQ